MKASELTSIENVLSRSEMKNILAGGYACKYYVSGSWTGKLTGCSTTTTTIDGGGSLGVPYAQVDGGVSSSTSEERCCYDVYDPYNMGFENESRCINGAVARQC